MVSSVVAALQHWWQASRPLAQVNIALPLLLGQAAAWHVERAFEPFWLGAGILWGVLDHAFIVYANDYADRDFDTLVRTPISGGSGVLAEGKLAPAQLRRAASVSVALLLGWSLALACLGRLWTPVYALFAFALLWLYSFGPARLSHRGGGELLQGVGIGVGLPSLGYYLQCGGFFAPLWVLLPGTVLGVGGNVLTSLPDLEVDQNAGKRTWSVRFGISNARRVTSACIAFATLGVFAWTPDLSIGVRAWIGIAPLVPLVWGARARDVLGAALWMGAALHLLLVSWIVALWLSP